MCVRVCVCVRLTVSRTDSGCSSTELFSTCVYPHLRAWPFGGRSSCSPPRIKPIFIRNQGCCFQSPQFKNVPQLPGCQGNGIQPEIAFPDRYQLFLMLVFLPHPEI